MSDTPNNPYTQGNPYNRRTAPAQGTGYNPYNQGNPYSQGGPAKYCTVCGHGLVAQAVICPNCGSPVGAGYGRGYKTKTAAVLLAVFLGPWTWLYTYRRNAWKFWAGLVSGILGAVVAAIVVGIYFVNVNQASTPSQFNQPSAPAPALATFAVVVCYLIPFAVWIWAIVDAAFSPATFYYNYPNG